MSQRASATLIGAFVVGAIALTVIAFLLLGNVGLFEDREKIVIYFRGSVDGLHKGAPVNVRGVKIGTVIDIDIEINPLDGELFIPVIVQFEPDAVEYVRTIQIPDPDQDRLKYLVEELGLRAQLHLQSILTSQMSIQLDYHPNTEFQYHGSGDLREIPTIPMAFEQLSEQLQNLPLDQILDDITSTLSSINEIVSSADTMELTKTLNKTMNSIDELARNMNDTLKPLADKSSKTLGSIDELAQNLNRNIQPLADNTIQALLDAQKALREIEILLNEDSTQVYHLNIALEEIVSAARSIRIFAETIERQPETLLKGKNPRD